LGIDYPVTSRSNRRGRPCSRLGPFGYPSDEGLGQTRSFRTVARKEAKEPLIAHSHEPVVTGQWPVQLVGRAVLCPPLAIHERRARSDAPYRKTAHRAVATGIGFKHVG